MVRTSKWLKRHKQSWKVSAWSDGFLLKNGLPNIVQISYNGDSFLYF